MRARSFPGLASRVGSPKLCRMPTTSLKQTSVSVGVLAEDVGQRLSAGEAARCISASSKECAAVCSAISFSAWAARRRAQRFGKGGRSGGHRSEDQLITTPKTLTFFDTVWMSVSSVAILA